MQRPAHPWASGLWALGLLVLPLAAAAADGPLGALPKSFAGTLPAASGPGIDWQLDLLDDGSFQLRRTYLGEAPDNVVDTIGRWVVGSDGASLALGDADGPIGFAIETPDRLRLLDTALRPIVSDLPYTLAAADLAPLEPELRLSGMYRYMADAALFDECRTGRRLPVAFVGDNLALERAYTSLGASGAPVLAELDGRIALLPPMEGDGLVPQLEPVAFVALHPDGACPEPFGQVELASGEWQLVGLGEDDIALAEGQMAPNLLFSAEDRRVSGFGGCNRLIGGYAAYGSQLRFSHPASTMMACAVGMDLEHGLFEAMIATERYRVLGRQLDLLDAKGASLARFVLGTDEVAE